MPIRYRQSFVTATIFLCLTFILVALVSVEFTWNATTSEETSLRATYPKFSSLLGDVIASLCLETQAAAAVLNNGNDEEIYAQYLLAQSVTDAAYNASYSFIINEKGMHWWDDDYTLENNATIMTAQSLSTIKTIRAQMTFNQEVYSTQTVREKYFDSIKRVISLLETISEIYHSRTNVLSFSKANALSSAAFAILQVQEHTLLINNYLVTGVSSTFIEAEEKELIRYMYLYMTLIDLFVLPMLSNDKKYYYLIDTTTTFAEYYVVNMFNEVTSGKTLPPGLQGIETDSLDSILRVSSLYQQDLNNIKTFTSSKKLHSSLLLVLLLLGIVALLTALGDFVIQRFYDSKSSMNRLHNSSVMHDLLLRVSEYAQEIGTFSLSPLPPPLCLVEERRVGIVEQQLQFLVGSLRSIAFYLPPLLLPYNFILKAEEYSEVKDPATMVLTDAPRKSLENLKLSLEEKVTFPHFFVPMAHKTDIQEQICDVALLYVSLSSFHELDTHEKRTLSAENYKEIVSIIEECVYQYRGVVTTVAFERAVAVWNVAHQSSNFCEQAAACALKLSERLRNKKKFVVHLGVVGGTVSVGIFGNEERKILSIFGPPVLRGMFVAQTNGYHMTRVSCDDYVRAAIQKKYYCKPIELIPEEGCVHQILHRISKDDSELELQLATYGQAFEFFERQCYKSALKAFRAYTKQYGYDSSVERIQALIVGS